MRLYLIRHGVSVDKTEFQGADDDRPLTTKGRRELVRLFRSLRGEEEPPEEIWTSPIVRSVQTAEICAHFWSDDVPVKVTRSLLSEAPAQALLDEIAQKPPKSPVAFVGHEPHLGLLLAHLTGARPGLGLPKGSMCRVRFRPEDSPQGKFTCCHVAGRDDVVVDLESLYR